MGLLDKIKNVLFEEEVIELPVEEKKIVQEEKRTEPPVVEKKTNFVETEIEEPKIPEKDLFKSDKTFDFPVFDDEEFESMKNDFEDTYEDETKKSMCINLFDYEKPKIKKTIKAEEIKGRAYENKKSDYSSRKFQPSPVISPVYGVLDKNYKKEDIIVKNHEKKQFDVDDVRKKAFGTLEDDIERSLRKYQFDEPKQKEPIKKPKEKTISELLEETALDSISVNTMEEVEEVIPEKVEILERKNRKIETPKIEIHEPEDTLENDLFDLIDSMYENREDE